MFNSLNSTLKKVIIVFLIITLTYANFVLIGNHIMQGLISYALEEGEETLVVANQKLVMNKVCEVNGEQKRVIQVAVEIGIESEEYPIKEVTVTLSTDIIEEALEDVKVTELNKNTYTSGTWAISETGKLVISLVNENETLESKDKGLDKLLVTYVFPNSEIETIEQPLEKVELKIYEEEILVNEYAQNNFEDINVEKELSLLNIGNKDIHKTTIESGKVDYIETLNLDLSYRDNATNITIEDISNKFYNIDEQENEDVSLKYIKTILNKEDLEVLLGETGKLVITDKETNKELITIIKDKLTNEESEKQYYEEAEEQELRSELSIVSDEVIIEYSIDVASLKIEFIDIVPQSSVNIDISDFVIKNTKSILNVSDIENLSYLQENVKYIVNEEKTVQSVIDFKDTVTRASLEVDNTEWVVGEANTANYTITLDTTTEKSELFVNPMFLIELPSSVETINTANSEFTVNNDGGAFTNKKVFTTTVLGKKYVVVTLIGEQTVETIQNGNTLINIKLEVNVSADETEVNETTKIYYQNDTVTTYENGASFDTDEVEISLVLGNEDKEEISEEVSDYIDVYLEMKSSTEQLVELGETLEYTLQLYNFTLEEVTNLVLTETLPKGVTLQNVVNEDNEAVNYEYNEETRTIKMNIEKMDAAVKEEVQNEVTSKTETVTRASSKVFKIVVVANNIDVDNIELKNTAKIEKNQVVLDEAEVINKILVEKLNVEVDNLTEQINENEEIVLSLKIENVGSATLKDINVKINLPEEIYTSVYEQYIINDAGEQEFKTESTLSNNFEVNILEIPAGKTHYLKLIGTIEDIEETKQLNIYGNVNDEEIIWTTQIVNRPEQNEEENPSEPNNPENPNNPSGPNNPENPDNPSGPNNPENPDNPSGPNNPESPDNPSGPNNPESPDNPSGPNNPGNPDNPSGPNNPESPDNPSGPNNPEDSDNPSGPNNPENPDEIIDGFDLSLTQYLNKVTVTNTQGTTTYDYTNTNFAKVEIHSKYMNGSKITLEYKIVVKNNGTIPGYARKIVNYLPEGLTFNPELNKDWYLGDDGNIYSVALIEKLLNSGETAELKIILEKQMTNESTGNITNIVEIYEASNEENVEDINSIPGDKLEGQNDMSKVEVLVATSTGTIILYITLFIVVITILGIGFYKVKKVALIKKGGC